MEKFQNTIYLAPEGYLNNLKDELKDIDVIYDDRLVSAFGDPQNAYWAENVWQEPYVIGIDSISDGIKKLTDIQRNWALYSVNCHRRAKHIQEGLPRFSRKPKNFPLELPKAPMGSWLLADENTIIASPKCSSLFPNGEIVFNEDKINPPNRAYLKLWELFTRTQTMPKKDELCLDMGASPGGWTWVLSQLGANVISVDRAALAPNIEKLSNVKHIQYNAFTVKPAEIGRVDWFFSDVICYPDKLWKWVSTWLDSGLCGKFVCTIKFQGKWNRDIVEKFQSVPGSSLVHLFYNKHELTWFLI
jgi:23S rRNA (cytidine2498-2'-O)-methyltransferase